MGSILARKPLQTILEEASQEDEHSLPEYQPTHRALLRFPDRLLQV